MDRRQRRPSDDTLRWVERAVGDGAYVASWRRLTGGITASVHRLTLLRPASDERVRVVLRRWLPQSAEWNEWARRSVVNEGHVLTSLESAGIPAPRLIATTDGSETGGVPATLMTCLPGRIVLDPKRPEEWLAQIAAMLPRIHDASISAPPWQPWIDPGAYELPPWSERPGLWRTARRVVREVPPDRPETFIHGDYQHFNLLWTRRRMTAVVDWVNASTGPPDIDVGHCRLNLAVLFSADLAENFRLRFEAEAGREVDPRFDLYSLLSYDQDWKRFIPFQVHGRAPIDLAGMDRRVEDTIAATVARL